MERIIIVILAGIVGGVFANKVGFPGGAVVGSMLFSAVFAVAIPGRYVVPDNISTAIQIMLGTTLGMTFDRTSLSLLPKVVPLAMIGTLALLFCALAVAWSAQKLGLIDFPTALFGSSPGGMVGMSLIAQSGGLKADAVAVMHTVRIFSLFIIIPFLVKLAKGWLLP